MLDCGVIIILIESQGEGKPPSFSADSSRRRNVRKLHGTTLRLVENCPAYESHALSLTLAESAVALWIERDEFLALEFDQVGSKVTESAVPSSESSQCLVVLRHLLRSADDLLVKDRTYGRYNASILETLRRTTSFCRPPSPAYASLDSLHFEKKLDSQ